ncbi:flagellar basal body P-ring biosynthesis protein [Gordonia spumicola]|uniref:Flagellar basal body P-ring biosynthesis protein n=1 Tax=Gordonia spumicola TaxID=589161 RepID=A0A7I9V6S0_9ACTN|nr:SAF domain-containing protein [Gordonia spumicola]GEE00987.1 flagellar basal body P-ring biosynthesis protein [Gordonia spumicola]
MRDAAEHRDLDPSLLDRLRSVAAPGWARSVALRRTAAVVLVLAAGVLSVVESRTAAAPTAVVATRDLRPGTALTQSDVRLAPVPASLMPDDAPSLGDVTGARVTGPVHAGEIIARHRLLDSRLPAELTGDADARLVPVRPADDSSTVFIRTGDAVDLLTEDGDVLARNATVALTPQTDGPERAGPVLVALPAAAAHRVAAAGLREQITFVLH